MNMTKSNMKRDIPINIGVTLLLIFLGMNKTITGCETMYSAGWTERSF